MLSNVLRFVGFCFLTVAAVACALGIFHINPFGTSGVGLIIGLVGLVLNTGLEPKQQALKNSQWWLVIGAAIIGLCVFGHAPLIVVIAAEIVAAIIGYEASKDHEGLGLAPGEVFGGAIVAQNLVLVGAVLATKLPWWGDLIGLVIMVVVLFICLFIGFFSAEEDMKEIHDSTYD